MLNHIRKTATKTGWVHVSVASTVLVNVCAFAMSLVSLTDLAGEHGVPMWQAWMLPLVLEGLVMASTAGTVNLDGKRAAYAWVLMILSTLTAASGNVTHAYLAAGQIITVDSVVAMTVAAIPSFWLLLSTHLTVMLINHPKAVKESPAVPVMGDIHTAALLTPVVEPVAELAPQKTAAPRQPAPVPVPKAADVDEVEEATYLDLVNA